GVLALAATSTAGASPSHLTNAVLASVAGKPSAAVAALARGGAMNGISNKSLLAALLLVGTAALGIGLASGTPTAAGPLPQNDPPKVVPKPPEVANAGAVNGRVVDPDGKPVAGAKLYLTPWMGYLKEAFTGAECVTAGADGRFTFPEKEDRGHIVV